MEFTRHSNTRLSNRNLAHSAFGPESPWSHNYEWLMRDNGGAPTRPIITVPYPNGNERNIWYKTGSTTEWVTTTPYRNPDRILTDGDDFVLHTGGLERYHFKRRVHSDTGGVFYRLEAITDPQSNTHTLSYDDPDDTLVRQITDPAGHSTRYDYDHSPDNPRGDVNRIRIGARANVQDGAILHVSRASARHPEGAPLRIGDAVTLGHGVILHGCAVHDECLIGMGALVMDHAVLEPRVLLGAGSLVPEGRVLQSGWLYVGRPAQPVRRLNEEELAAFARQADNYVRLAAEYLTCA